MSGSTLFLSGPMGAGKSTVLARLVGQGRGVDLDEAIEAREGASVAEIFASRGESRFRQLEAEVLDSLLSEADAPSIIALGGGTVTNTRLRRRLLRQGVLVTLMADAEVLASRVGNGEGRPLLADASSLRDRLADILASRRAAYAEAHAVVDAAAPIAERVAAIRAVWDAAPLAIALGERSYRVDVGSGVRARFAGAVGERRAVLVADTNTAPWRDELAATLTDPILVTLPAGEEHKSVHALELIWDAALEGGADRRAIVVAVGGGVVGDLAGAAAATLLRGVAFGQVPTSLLAMVDSSVGGKTGFNRPQGKNLVGAFHQPDFVLCDVETLSTLPREEFVAGLAEVAKAAWLEGGGFVSQLEADAAGLLGGDDDALVRAIRRAVALKADVVARDERESGARMLLNLGHTVGHAIEAAAGYGSLRHGEAVSLGMVAAANLGRRLGTMDQGTFARMVTLLDALGLPTDLKPHFQDEGALARFLGSDKKRRGDQVHFIVPGVPGRTEIRQLPVSEVLGLARP